MKQHKAYNYRIYPNSEQQVFFLQTFGCKRLVYNLMLHDKIENMQARRNDPNIPLIKNYPASYKQDYPFLRDVDSLALNNAWTDVNAAFAKYFKEKSVGFPRFKSKKNPVQSYRTNNQNGTIKLVNNKFLKLPKLKSLIPIKLHRQPQGLIKSATVSREANGQFRVSLLCETEIDPLEKTGSVIGIDLGIRDFAIFSDGRKVNNHHFTLQMEQRLEREQRKLSRRALLAKQRGVALSDAKNYQKQKRKVARLHTQVANQRKDFLHKLSTEIIKNHDVICLEDLNVKGMTKNRKLSKSISDVSWSSFVTMLQYKADWYDKTIVKIDRWYPSTQTCSACGHRGGKKGLSVTDWTCPVCHVHHDRDINAAINIRNEGLRLLTC